MIKMSKHPAGFYTLFFTELWERFNYYGILSILVIYLTKYFLVSDIRSYIIYGIYTTLAFATPILGGFVADKLRNRYLCIVLGLIVTLLGNLALIFPHLNIQYIGLSCIIMGIGLCKANNASLLGSLYEDLDARKESGFTIFYMGMNIGAIFGPICFGYIMLSLSWQYCFILSSIGIILNLILLLLKRDKFIIDKKLKTTFNFSLKTPLLFIAVGFLIFIFAWLFKHKIIFNVVLLVFLILITLVILNFIYKESKPDRKKICLLLVLNIFSIFYFAASFQTCSSLLLFIERFVNVKLFTLAIPTPVYAALNPFFVIISAPLWAPLWRVLGKKFQTNIVIFRVKLGLLLATISFIFFTLATTLVPVYHAYFSLLFIILGNFALGSGELCIGPALISAVTYLAPKERQGTFMGIWCLSIALAAYLSSVLAKLSATSTTASLRNLSIYYHAFLQITILTLLVTLILLVVSPQLKRLAR